MNTNNQLVYAFDSQQLSAWEMCPQKFDISYIQHLELRQNPPGILKGAAMHKCYEEFYLSQLQKEPYEVAVRRATQKLIDYATETKMEQEMLLLCLSKAASYFVEHKNALYRPLQVETGFSHIIYENKQFKILYEGRIDLIAQLKYNNQFCWVDHKNYLIKEKPSFNTNQFYGYTWILYELFPRSYFGQGLQDCTWMAASNTGPKAHDTFMQSFTRDQVEEWKEGAIASLLEMAAYVNSRNWRYTKKPRKNIHSCTAGKYGGCKFMPICHAGNTSSQLYQISTKLKSKEKRWSAWDTIDTGEVTPDGEAIL